MSEKLEKAIDTVVPTLSETIAANKKRWYAVKVLENDEKVMNHIHPETAYRQIGKCLPQTFIPHIHLLGYQEAGHCHHNHIGRTVIEKHLKLFFGIFFCSYDNQPPCWRKK